MSHNSSQTASIVGPLVAAAIIALIGIGASACMPPPPVQKPVTQGDAGSTAGSTAGPAITIASQSGDFKTPLDSVPDPEGKTIYFTAENSKGKGIFKVDAAGGSVTEVFVGQPFMAPTGVGMSPDGKQVFVADPTAGNIFALTIGSDAAPIAVKGTQNTSARGMDIVTENGQVVIYFSGKDTQGQPAVFKVAAAGADTPQVILKGAPLAEPDGIAVAPDGTVYVSDRAAARDGNGAVFQITADKATALIDSVRTGTPAGIALTKDGSTLLVSALQPDGKSDQVLVVNVASKQTTSVTDVVGQNKDAGGVHRAYNVNVFSWADFTAGGSGRVYRVNP